MKQLPLLTLLFALHSLQAQEAPNYKIGPYTIMNSDLQDGRSRDTVSEMMPVEARRFRDFQARRNDALDFFNTILQIQEPTTVSGTGLLDRNWNTHSEWQKKPFLLNVDARAPIPFGGKDWILPTGPLMFALHLVPEFKLRILANDSTRGDRSFPVRTPSYIPGINLFVSHRELWRKPVPTYCMVRLFHHSDGQDGPQFDSEGWFNTYNGDFGDNLVLEVAPGFFLKKETHYSSTRLRGKAGRLIKRPVMSERRSHWNYFYGQIGYEHHFRKVLAESLLLGNIYGRHRINLNAGWIKLPDLRLLWYMPRTKQLYPVELYHHTEGMRVTFNASYILDHNYSSGPISQLERIKGFNLGKRLNVCATVYGKIRSTPYSYVFVQAGYYGSDPYSVYFQQSIGFVRAGIAAGFYTEDNLRDLMK